ncbi:DUF1211 domain-containing protein [Patescibacteria group bacterium]|nr:DUF1211 domain-containing protein [Patescibacteria group bacterium]
MNTTRSKKSMPLLSTRRMEALTDGVFAIAMTLLVLDFKVPTIPEGSTVNALPRLILGLWPNFFNYVQSFILLAIFWIVHHRQYHYIKFVDQGLLWLNILGLMFIVLIPFSTSLIAQHGDVQIGALIFECNLLAIGCLFYMQWWYVTGKHHLLDCDLSAEAILLIKKRNLVVPIVSLLAIGLSFLTPEWSEVPYFAIPFIMIKYRRR